MGHWVELELRYEDFNLIVGCLENCACKSNDFQEIEEIVWLIDNLYEQKEEYTKKLFSESNIKF